MRHKTIELIEVKAEGEAGQFTALASVFGNVDAVGDRMLPGAFSKTLADWRASGDPIPVVLSHQWDDPMAYVGKADPNEVVETDQGLVVTGRLDMQNPVSKQVYSLMKQRLLKGWSFGYTVPDGGERYRDGVNEVSQVELIEVGPTLKGANPEAQLQAIKSLKQMQDEPQGGTLRVINAMIGMAQEFIGAEPEPADREKMQGVLDVLSQLAEAERAEGEKKADGEGKTLTEQPPPPRGEDVGREEPEGSVAKASDPLKDEIDRAWIDVHAGIP